MASVTITTCDVCKKETKVQSIYINTTPSSYYGQIAKIDICDNCRAEYNLLTVGEQQGFVSPPGEDKYSKETQSLWAKFVLIFLRGKKDK